MNSRVCSSNNECARSIIKNSYHWKNDCNPKMTLFEYVFQYARCRQIEIYVCNYIMLYLSKPVIFKYLNILCPFKNKDNIFMNSVEFTKKQLFKRIHAVLHIYIGSNYGLCRKKAWRVVYKWMFGRRAGAAPYWSETSRYK